MEINKEYNTTNPLVLANVYIADGCTSINSSFEVKSVTAGLNHLGHPAIYLKESKGSLSSRIALLLSIGSIQALVNDLNLILEHYKKQQP